MTERTPPKPLVSLLGLLQLVLFVAALISIIKKSVALKDKLPWILVSLVNFIGPIIYFVIGSDILNEKSANNSLEQEEV